MNPGEAMQRSAAAVAHGGARAASDTLTEMPSGGGAMEVAAAAATSAIAIVGGGPAGMALALALHRRGIACEIFEARSRAALLRDQRVLALSHGTQQILTTLGVWPGLCAARAATAIDSIHISHRGGLGRTRLSAADLAVPALGQVVPAHALIGALDAQVRAQGIVCHEHYRVDADAAKGLLERFALLAWAEGSVDAAAATQRDYDQHAVLCVATPAAAHRHIAWERFTDAGPVALLPLGDDYAVVLAVRNDALPAVLAADDAAFIALLHERFGARVRFTAVSARSSYPLGLRYRDSPVGERALWLGNAAQTLHPVAGQGFNLALRDVMEFADCAHAFDDRRAPALLAEYARRRALDRRGMIGFTDTLIDTFGSDFAPLRHARGAGLLALDLLPPLRRFLARRMMYGARAW